MADPNQVPIDEAAHQAARKFMWVTTPLLVLAGTVTSARLIAKRRSALLFRWDDGLIVIGCLLSATVWALLCHGIVWFADSSHSFATVPTLQRVVKFGILGAVMWAVSTYFIKLSVAISLFRFQQNRAWQLFLQFIIAISSANAFVLFLFPLLQCQPLAATWNLSITGAKCVTPQQFRLVSNTGTIVNIVTDVILSLYPLTFLHRLRRPILEKALIFLLMAMGVTAGAASIMKLLYVTVWVHATMTFSVGFTISMWTCVEIFIGITAACLPSLKSTMQRALVWCRILPRGRNIEEHNVFEGETLTNARSEHEIRTNMAFPPTSNGSSSPAMSYREGDSVERHGREDKMGRGPIQINARHGV